VKNRLTEAVLVVDTDCLSSRKQIASFRVPIHNLPGLHMISRVGSIPQKVIDSYPPPLPNPMEWRHLLATSSFRAPVSPVVLLLLMDLYPPKQLCGALHALFLLLLIDARLKCRFAAYIGSIAYRPLSTLVYIVLALERMLTRHWDLRCRSSWLVVLSERWEIQWLQKRVTQVGRCE
jgi:hypothetical protein